MSITFRTCLAALALGAVAIALSPGVVPMAIGQPPATQPAKEALSIRVYELADMVLPLPNHGYRSDLLPTVPTAENDSNGASTGGNVGGGGGFGGGGGGAAFNVQLGAPSQPTQTVQLGGGGIGVAAGGGGGAVGRGGGGGGDDETRAMGLEEIQDIIHGAIAPETWDINGGPCSIRCYRSLLIITQTAEVHTAIGEFLSTLRQKVGTAQTVTVSANWLQLDSDQLGKLQLEEAGRTRIDRAELKNAARAVSSMRGQISCFSGQTVHLVSGERRNVVTSAIPVVGGDVAAYQPRSTTPNLGVLLQVRPTLLADGSAAIVDIQNWVTDAPTKSETLAFQSKDVAAGADAATPKRASDTTGVHVDRLNIKSQSLATTLRVPVGVPILVGGLTMPETTGAPAATEERKQLYLVIQVNVTEDIKTVGATNGNSQGSGAGSIPPRGR